MGDAKKKANPIPNPTIRRTSISAVGKVTESQIPLNSLKQEAIDLSAGTNLPTTLLVTREAAMKITEKAISSALENAWSDLVKEQQPIPSSLDNTKTPAIGSSHSHKANRVKASSLKGDPMEHKTVKKHNKPVGHHSKKGPEISAVQGLKSTDPHSLSLQLNENNVSLQEPETGHKKPKVDSKSSPAMGSKKQTPKSITKKSASSPSHGASKKKAPKEWQ